MEKVGHRRLGRKNRLDHQILDKEHHVTIFLIRLKSLTHCTVQGIQKEGVGHSYFLP